MKGEMTLFTPETEQQAKRWVETSVALEQKKGKPIALAGKVSVIWDAKKILWIDCPKKSQTITGDYCANLDDQLSEKAPHDQIYRVTNAIRGASERKTWCVLMPVVKTYTIFQF